MRLDAFLKALKENNTKYEINADMSKRTTFKIGGLADALVTPQSAEELLFVLKSAKENDVPYFVLGNGSNLLVSDNGIEGAVIDMGEISGIKISGDTVICGAGESLRSVCLAARDAALTGLEFAYGIPGSVGGAFFMNAGAYGGEISQVALSAVCIDKELNLTEITASDMQLGYRSSAFQKNKMIIVSVKIALKKGNKDEISEKMNEIFKKRVDKQPLDYPSAGSTFKRPTGYFAGTLIEENGLKGTSCGKAQVSEKHAGFIINTGGATAKDVLNLIEKVKETVKCGSGVTLEPEVLFVGRRQDI